MKAYVLIAILVVGIAAHMPASSAALADGPPACVSTDMIEADALSCDSGALASSSGSKCHSWAQTWDVQGSSKGSGAVKFWVQCGDNQGVSVCNTIDLPECKGDEGKGDGKLGCWYTVLSGSPTDIIGKCVDPANPDIAFHAIAFGQEFVADQQLIPQP